MKNTFSLVAYILFPLYLFFPLKSNNKDFYNDINHIYIPKINLSNNIYGFIDEQNNVNKNIYLAQDYDFDSLKGALVLASHSGNSPVSYFNDIDKLSLGDEIFVEDKNNIYTYLVDNIFVINKTGFFKYDNKDKYVYLVTCVKNKHKKQLVIGGFLSKITKKSTFS